MTHEKLFNDQIPKSFRSHSFLVCALELYQALLSAEIAANASALPKGTASEEPRNFPAARVTFRLCYLR